MHQPGLRNGVKSKTRSWHFRKEMTNWHQSIASRQVIPEEVTVKDASNAAHHVDHILELRNKRRKVSEKKDALCRTKKLNEVKIIPGSRVFFEPAALVSTILPPEQAGLVARKRGLRVVDDALMADLVVARVSVLVFAGERDW